MIAAVPKTKACARKSRNNTNKLEKSKSSNGIWNADKKH